MEKEVQMYTEKAIKFQKITNEIKKLVQHHCMPCAYTTQEDVDKVAEILKSYSIDPKDVEAEMSTLTSNFAFSEGWRKSRGNGCYVNLEDFLAVCYKFLK